MSERRAPPRRFFRVAATCARLLGAVWAARRRGDEARSRRDFGSACERCEVAAYRARSAAAIFARVSSDIACPRCGCRFPLSAALIFARAAADIGPRATATGYTPFRV
jgi:hypothetical protein